jgi:hypothetical protein
VAGKHHACTGIRMRADALETSSISKITSINLIFFKFLDWTLQFNSYYRCGTNNDRCRYCRTTQKSAHPVLFERHCAVGSLEWALTEWVTDQSSSESTSRV